jgi:hypothetical protein
METSSMQSPDARPKLMDEPHIETIAFDWKLLYTIGAVAALVEIAIIVIQAPIFILYPQPTTVMGHFMQFQSNKLLGLLDLDLMLILGEAFSVLILLALYAALRRASPSLMTIALTLGLGGIALYFAVNPTFSMLYLSDQYAAATTDAQRAAFLTAGEALWANYNGTAFDLFFVLSGVADLIIAAVMWRSGVFSKMTAYVGILIGVMLLVPGSASVGTIGVLFSTIIILPSVIWYILIARRLFLLAQASSRKEVKRKGA